jgi:hypothetical protein
MATYLFLSDEWLDEARAIRAEFDGKGAPIDHSIRMNLIVCEVPFGEGTVLAHVDTSTGELVLDTGHIDPVDLKVSLDYDVARAILIEGNPQAGTHGGRNRPAHPGHDRVIDSMVGTAAAQRFGPATLGPVLVRGVLRMKKPETPASTATTAPIA